MTKAQIMTRAHEIAKSLEGDYMARMSLALRQAWAEAKAPAKATFKGYATISHQLSKLVKVDVSFKLWENYGKRRIYFESTSCKAIKGYIDLDNGSQAHIISKKYIGIEKVVDSFFCNICDIKKRQRQKMKKERFLC